MNFHVLGQAALETACSSGNYEQVAAFLKEQKPTSLQSSLHAAARNGHPDIVTLLLSKGAEFDRETVWAALESQSIPVFQALLDAGWDIEWRLSHCGTTLTRAVIMDDVALVDILLKNGADPSESVVRSALATAAIFSSTGVVENLLAHGVQIKQSGALEYAACDGRLEMIAYLLDHGADINEISNGDSYTPFQREDGLGTALHIAARKGKKEAVELLLESGADPTLKDTKGKTAFQVACEAGHSEIAQLLLGAVGWAGGITRVADQLEVSTGAH